jgi:WD40 repeat protein
MTVSGDRTVNVWNAATSELAIPPLPGNQFPTHAEFSPDGRRVLTVAIFDRTAQVWDVATGQPAAPVISIGGHGRARLSPDGTRVLTVNAGYNVGNGLVRVWDATTGQSISPEWKTAHLMRSAAFRPDGQRVVTA